jgi:hypothetical protein
MSAEKQVTSSISELENEYNLLCESEVNRNSNILEKFLTFILKNDFIKKKIDEELSLLLGNQNKLETKLLTLKNVL